MDYWQSLLVISFPWTAVNWLASVVWFINLSKISIWIAFVHNFLLMHSLLLQVEKLVSSNLSTILRCYCWALEQDLKPSLDSTCCSQLPNVKIANIILLDYMTLCIHFLSKFISVSLLRLRLLSVKIEKRGKMDLVCKLVVIISCYDWFERITLKFV